MKKPFIVTGLALGFLIFNVFAVSAWAQETIDFESFNEGDFVSQVFGDEGSGPILVNGVRPGLAGQNAAMIYDSSCPPDGVPGDCSGGDSDLGTPNENFGGPGVGPGGASGPFANTEAQGNLLIVSEDLDSNDPDDADVAGATLEFDFSAIGSVTVTSILIIDVEADETGAQVDFFDADNDLITTVFLPDTDDNGVATTIFNVSGVVRMEVLLNGSGAIDDIVFIPDVEPAIDIRKQIEGPDSRTFVSGTSVTFEIEVTNTGNVDLTDVVVTDDEVPGCDYSIGNLAAGASTTYTCTAPNVTASFENVACVTGQANGAQVEDCDPSTVEIIDIDIRKQAEGPDSRTFPAGSDVEFEIVVTNTGDEDLINVGVTDALVPGCAQSIGNLAAGVSVVYNCTASNVTEGFVNEACVTGERNGLTVSDCDPSTVVIEEVAIDIRKEAEGDDTRTFPSGSDVTFAIVVTNTGQADLSNVAVTDAEVAGCSNAIGDLAAGASFSYTCTAPDVTMSFVNEACVAGEALGVTVEDCDPSTVEIIDIDIRKQEEGPDTRTFPQGSDIEFEIVVTNTGDEDLENVIVTDVLVPACDRDIGLLASGESVTYTCTAPDVTMSFTNEACVSGERNGVTVEDCDPSTVEIEGGGQGCTPGYWKQEQHFDSWTSPYTPGTPFSSVFEDAFPGKTLLQVLKQGGGGLKALGRHTVAALLNAASPDVSYDLTVDDVIDMFNAEFPDGDYEYLKNYFEGFNEQGCPLN